MQRLQAYPVRYWKRPVAEWMIVIKVYNRDVFTHVFKCFTWQVNLTDHVKIAPFVVKSIVIKAPWGER